MKDGIQIPKFRLAFLKNSLYKPEVNWDYRQAIANKKDSSANEI